MSLSSVLLHSVRYQEYDTVLSLLKENDIQIDEPEEDNGETPLFCACFLGHKRMVSILIEHGADVNKPCTDVLVTPLLAACRCNKSESVDIARILLESRSDPNLAGRHRTPLMEACMSGNIEIVKLLIERNVDPNHTYKGLSPLLVAARFADPDLARILLENNSIINISRPNGNTPLIEASVRGCHDMIKVMIEYNADVNCAREDNGVTALMAAVRSANKESVDLLLNSSADVNMKRSDTHQTALMEAMFTKNDDIVKKLVEANANLNAKRNDGRYVLSMAYTSDISDYLVKNGANLNFDELYSKIGGHITLDELSLLPPPVQVHPYYTISVPPDYDSVNKYIKTMKYCETLHSLVDNLGPIYRTPWSTCNHRFFPAEFRNSIKLYTFCLSDIITEDLIVTVFAYMSPFEFPPKFQPVPLSSKFVKIVNESDSDSDGFDSNLFD